MAKTEAKRKEPITGVKDSQGNSVEVDDWGRACVEVPKAILDDGTYAPYIDKYDPCNIDCDDPCPPPEDCQSALGQHLKLPAWIFKCKPLIEEAVGKRLRVRCDENTGEMWVPHSDAGLMTEQWTSGRVDVNEESNGEVFGDTMCIEFTNTTDCSINAILMADFSTLYEHPEGTCYQQSMCVGLNTPGVAETPALEPGLCTAAGAGTVVRNETYSWQGCVRVLAGETYTLCMKVGMMPSPGLPADQEPYNFRAYQMALKICPTGGGA